MFGIHKEDGKHKEIRECDEEAQREIIKKKEFDEVSKRQKLSGQIRYPSLEKKRRGSETGRL